MSRIFSPFLKLCTHLLWILLLFFICRICFIFFNYSYFNELTSSEIIKLIFNGFRFDISAILVINSLFILLSLLPFDTVKFNAYKIILKVVFIITNVTALLFEIGDWMYFPFNHKRSTAEVLGMVSRKGDFLTLLPSFLIDFWYAFVIAAILIFMIIWSYSQTEKYYFKKQELFLQSTRKIEFSNYKLFFFRLIILLLTGGLTVIGIRGGLQLIPINIRNAVEAAKSEHTPIVLNTPFSIINSFASTSLEEKKFMENKDAISLIKPVKHFNADKEFQKKNIVIIILESFSKEFTQLSGERSYTPNLDKIMDEGLVFTNAYANGLHSAEGIPAIIAGIPSLMEENFIVSMYSTNNINSFPSLLKPLGYKSVFYHGATNGSMSFDVFAKNAGFDHYYGRKEYNNEEDYDGSWGIFDEPFFQYFAAGMDTLSTPFLATIFSVTSHSPYPIPEKYKDKFSTKGLPIYATIEYSDYALGVFFDMVKEKPWFSNTLFIITADHTSPMTSNSEKQTGLARYEIPIIFYAPADSSLKGRNNEIMNQFDILPTALDYLKYNKPFFALGNSAFEKDAPRFMISELSGVYNWLYHDLEMKVFNDEPLEINVSEGEPNKNQTQNALHMWKAFIQVYNNSLIQNNMTVPRNY